MLENDETVKGQTVVEAAPDEAEQLEKRIKADQAKLKATKLGKRDKGFLSLLDAIGKVMGTQKQLGVTFIPWCGRTTSSARRFAG